MRLERKREEDSTGLPMAPLIDVVFLLLIFFMCQPFADGGGERIQLEKSRVQKSDETRGEQVLTVRLQSDGSVRVEEEEGAHTFATAMALGRFLKENGFARDTVTILLRPDSNCSQATVLVALEQISFAGVERISFLLSPRRQQAG